MNFANLMVQIIVTAFPLPLMQELTWYESSVATQSFNTGQLILFIFNYLRIYAGDGPFQIRTIHGRFDLSSWIWGYIII